MALSVVILAAGQGTRMKSALPKVLQPLAGSPMLGHVLETAAGLDAGAIHVVYGFGGERVVEAFPGRNVSWVLQAEQLGTGHAVAQAIPHISDDDIVLVLCGDVPLIRAESLQPVVEAARAGAAVLTVVVDDPQGYGRIVRDGSGQLLRIVEERDANESERKIDEINTGLIAARVDHLRRWLGALTADNAQGEYYLTDIVAMAVAENVPVAAVKTGNPDEVRGINDRVQLAQAERLLCLRRARNLMRHGVTVADPARLDVRGSVRSVIESSHAGTGCVIGPFARVRPGTELAASVKVGNFVEIKKSKVGQGSKVNHLTYVGDSLIGETVNVGAGTITCNYDGVNKHQTKIGDGAFIGSGVMLVAPVDIGAGATIGAGSVISRGAPAGQLTVARAPTRTISNWQRPKKDSAGK